MIIKPLRQIRWAILRTTRILHHAHPAQAVFFGTLSYIMVGWILLCIPFLQKGPGAGALDNLFIATSAVSTTGLATVSIADSYNFLGQFVVLLLIQFGGIGYMTFGSFVILSRKSGLSMVRSGIGETLFSLPAGFRIDKFIRSVIEFTVLLELAGTIALYFIFRHAGIEHPLWNGLFHSVSAFCTAGFSLFNTSLEGLADNFWLNAVVAILSYIGAVGFIVCVDFWRKWRGKAKTITLTSRIILWSTVWLTLGGTALLFLTEPSIRPQPADQRLLAAFFQTMTSMTTVGFNTISIAQMSKASLLLVVVLMLIGASPSGTGGGLKSTTVSAVFGLMRSALRGDTEVRFWNRVIPTERIWTACAGLGFYLFSLVIGMYLLELTETASFETILFESVSALGTVGLSMGLTAALTNLGKLIVIMLMFCGRLGPLTFGIAIFFRKGLLPAAHDGTDSDLAI